MQRYLLQLSLACQLLLSESVESVCMLFYGNVCAKDTARDCKPKLWDHAWLVHGAWALFSHKTDAWFERVSIADNIPVCPSREVSRLCGSWKQLGAPRSLLTFIVIVCVFFDRRRPACIMLNCSTRNGLSSHCFVFCFIRK